MLKNSLLGQDIDQKLNRKTRTGPRFPVWPWHSGLVMHLVLVFRRLCTHPVAYKSIFLSQIAKYEESTIIFQPSTVRMIPSPSGTMHEGCTIGIWTLETEPFRSTSLTGRLSHDSLKKSIPLNFGVFPQVSAGRMGVPGHKVDDGDLRMLGEQEVVRREGRAVWRYKSAFHFLPFV